MPHLPIFLSPLDMSRQLAARCRALRLSKNWTQNSLAERAGVSSASLKRFERTGKASLELCLRVSHALGRLDDFGQVMHLPRAQSMAELERQQARPLRKRGRK